jgi:hypothetical protein
MAPPLGGIRTSLSFQAKYGPLGQRVSDAQFGPGQPIPATPEEQIRVLDFPVGVNTQITPRPYEPFGFRQLRAFANVEPVRLAIETRKDQIERLDWRILPKDEKAAKGDESAKARCKALTKFFAKPDGVTPFAPWLRKTIEDLLAIDAPAWEKRRTVGGKLIGLDYVPGDTIKRLVDENGRTPLAPTPAYQQIIKGRVWADLSTEDLLYTPRNLRGSHLYGFSPVEQIIVTIQTVINRQAGQLAYFTEGNTPAGFLTGPEGWQPQHIKEMQQWLDSILSGDIGQRQKALFLPHGTTWNPFKQPPLKDDFDEWLFRIVAFAFSLPPTPFVKQMNRSTGETDQDRALEEGVEPLKLWVKRALDGVIEDEFGYDDIEFDWSDTPAVDPKIQSEIDDRNWKNGTSLLNEIRDSRGLDPVDGGDEPMFMTATGPVLLSTVIAGAAASVAASAALATNPQPVPAPGDQEQPGSDGSGAGEAEGEVAAGKVAKRAPKAITPDRPRARRATAAIKRKLAPLLQASGDNAAAQVAMALRGMHKAADDTGRLNAKRAADIAASVDLGFDPITDAVYDDLLDVAADSGVLALTSVGVERSEGLVDQISARAVDYARRRSAALVSLDGPKNIVDATRTAIRDAIAAGLDANLGTDAIADDIQGLTAFSTTRAGLIAETEVAMANGAGKQEGWRAAESTGLKLQASWQVSNDGDCCDDCQDNEDASPIPFGDTFPSGDDDAPAHPNCRCVTFAEPVDDGGEGDDE